LNIEQLVETVLFGNTLMNWGIAAGVFLAVYLGLFMGQRIVAHRLEKLAAKSETDLDDFIVDLIKVRTKRQLFLIYAAYAASQTLVIPTPVQRIITAGALLALAFQVGLWGNGIINYVVSRRTARDEGDEINIEAYSVISLMVKAVLWSVVVLVALNNMGIKVTALVAGLGVGGIAIALALQNILGDLFASLSIVFDRPFVIGDFIIVGDKRGTVEHVGLKTTRVRSLSGEQIVFSNTDLLSSRIDNYRRMNERRILFTLGITYQTPSDKLEAIPGMIQEIIEDQDQVRFDRSHFNAYGDFSLNFETVYYVLERDYALYMDIQQAINLAIYRKFEEEGIEFAYPTQTLFVEKGE
jgi:small-conductance mechanosensitive channel